MKIQLYSAHGEAQGQITASRASRMLADRDAVPADEQRCPMCRHAASRLDCEKCGGSGWIVTAIKRALGQAIIASPACITRHEVELALDGQRNAAAKLRWWPVTGTPALRHAQ